MRGEWKAPWGQVYAWTLDERTLTIVTQNKSDPHPRTIHVPAGVAYSIAREIFATKVRGIAEAVFR